MLINSIVEFILKQICINQSFKTNSSVCDSTVPFLVCWRTEGGGVATFIASP